MRGHKTIFDEDAELNEKWNPVVGYEGWYDVSDWGRVRRMKATSNTFVGRIIKPYANNKGYKCVGLLNGVEQKTVTVHRLYSHGHSKRRQRRADLVYTHRAHLL